FDSPKMHLNIIFQQGRRYNYCALLKKQKEHFGGSGESNKDYFKIVVFYNSDHLYFCFYIFS
ncbi:hypothetical protein, partial [Escherichia coli]